MFYVYYLIDPRDNRPFYVGKGRGKRIDAHEKEANLDPAKWVNPHKCNRIRQIWADGFAVKRRIIRYFSNERKAFEYEHHKISILPNLTNIVRECGSPGSDSWKPGALTDRLAEWVAQIIRESDGFKYEVKFVTDGMEPIWAKMYDGFNGYGLVKMVRLAMVDWIQYFGLDVVRQKFEPYGIQFNECP